MLPEYTCRRIDRDLRLTGKIDDPLWEEAPEALLTDPIAGGPKPFRTTARLLYNAQYLYLAFACEDDYIWGTFTEHDNPIFTEECVEAFICPSGMIRQYYELNVSPLNTTFDSFILNAFNGDDIRRLVGLDEFTCAGWLTAVHVDGTLGVPGGARGWSVEYAVPFTSLVGADRLVPAPGDAWRMNLYRIDSPQPGRLDFYAWAPLGIIDFHRPQCFGTLIFA